MKILHYKPAGFNMPVCGVFNPAPGTGRIKAVNCLRCKATVLFQISKAKANTNTKP